MIPRDYLTEWRKEAPWIDDAQVEQGLVNTDLWTRVHIIQVQLP